MDNGSKCDYGSMLVHKPKKCDEKKIRKKTMKDIFIVIKKKKYKK